MHARHTRNEHLALALLFLLLSAFALLHPAHASVPSHPALNPTAGLQLAAPACTPATCALPSGQRAKSNLPSRRFTRRHFAQHTPPPSLGALDTALIQPAPRLPHLRLPPSPALPNSSVPVALRQRAP